MILAWLWAVGNNNWAANAHDAGLVGGRGKPAGQLVLMMLGGLWETCMQGS